MLVDSHCHLPLIDLDKHGGVIGVLRQAREHGVGHMLCVSVDLETYPQVLELARVHAEVFASVGVHPNTRAEYEPTVEALADLAAAPEVVAIGETGLDYYRSQEPLEWQRDRFRCHIAAARQAAKPLIVHTRDAAQDVIRILVEEGADAVGGVMHCFVDNWSTAEQAMELNFYISFSGIVTFRNARQVHEVARRVPLDRLLVETDSPYLAPVPYRGKDNQPAYVRYVAEFIADLKGVPAADVIEATTRNFFKVFNSAVRAN